MKRAWVAASGRGGIAQAWVVRIPTHFGQQIRFYSDSDPIQFGRAADLIRTAIRRIVGQFFGPIGSLSEMVRTVVRNESEGCPKCAGSAPSEWRDATEIAIRVGL